ncbi:mono/diheme cytochrome c family protein/MFS family permease [Desulfobaculum xiamenense]|uniref:Mono/diheme cytochrome c family protein/MFS family permease n=1 Tax=Desulfobaculum xiamenense TaxID=995050 RepID=A0A846QN33_9BACT|nr:cytochrome C [Desulfobaculum xiamenense]NJB68597.1 mono/diheme cytochrome c family protein/MFS family permease [Desulfobaculum xiamenense]
MEYPVWQIPYFGGGILVAVIAVVHVFVAHFAVGGGLFLVLTEMLGHRRASRGILDYVRGHTLFFLLLTMVFGSLTGVAIWFIIALTNPAATLTLIRTYTFGWATEWVFFLGEIVTLLVYHYTFDSMERRRHLLVGWLYFGFGWLSLFMINGIIGSMLTPGDWVATGNFWDGFFNPSFWPSLVFRSLLAFSIAGLFAFLTAMRIEDDDLRLTLTRFAAMWAAVPVVLMAPVAWWYFGALPEISQAMITGRNNEIAPFLRAFLTAGPVVVAASLLMAARMPRSLGSLVAVLLLTAGFVQIGSFEWIREAARRPWIIVGHTYSNAITVADVARVEAEGFLKVAKWVEHREITQENRLDAGREIFVKQCLACHSVGGPSNDILPLTAKFTVVGMDSQLNGQGKLNDYMPPFFGTEEERGALAAYIVETLHGGAAEVPLAAEAVRRSGGTVDVPPFDPKADEYVLLAWNNLGMHCISDSDPFWILLPPANDLYCQLVRRGETPELVTEGVKITYRADDAFMNPSGHVRFWAFAESLFGKRLEANVGVSGNGLSGEMHFDEKLGAFEAGLIPVAPYPDEGGYNPYPLFTVEAHDATTGELLARTRTVAPTSTEMGCRNCHGGAWRVAGVAGFTDETSADVLAVHDRISKTDLLATAQSGKPMLCQSCHPDPVLGAEGKPGLLNLPAALHGWHANYLTDRGAEACAYCHPNAEQGATRCLRGVHAERGLDCTNCHGTLEDHALSLLKREDERGAPGAKRLMRQLAPRAVAGVADVNARTPWLGEPDCLTCHVDFQPPENDDAFNVWTGDATGLYRMRRDDMGALMCAACHGSPHAEYPAVADSGYGENRDNIPSLQYVGNAGPIGSGGSCGLCHVGTDMTAGDSAHHPKGFR